MTDALPDAFYLPVGEGRYEPTAATTSPWDDAAQHGGPPTALLATLMERTVDDPGLRLSRITAELLGPIPRRTVQVAARVVRPGRRVCMTEATLAAADSPERPAVLARAWHLSPAARPPAPATPGRVATVDPLPPADRVAPYRPLPGVPDTWGYGRSIEWRFVTGGFDLLGPAAVWTRLRIPFIAGEATAGLAHALVVADAANGISAELAGGWSFIPTSVTVHLRRHPGHEWLHLAATTTVGDDGIGLTDGTLADEEGLLGTVAQPLLLAPR